MSTVPVIFEGKPFTLATILNKHTKCLDLSLLEEKYAVVIHYNCWLLSNAGKKKWRSWILLHVSPSAAFSKYNTLECDINMKNNGLVKLGHAFVSLFIKQTWHSASFVPQAGNRWGTCGIAWQVLPCKCLAWFLTYVYMFSPLSFLNSLNFLGRYKLVALDSAHLDMAVTLLFLHSFAFTI